MILTFGTARILCIAAVSVACWSGAPPGDPRGEGAGPSQPIACAEASFDGSGLGALRIGATIETVRTACPVIRETPEIREEGLPARVLAVAFGMDTIEAEVDSGRVWRIVLSQPRFRTIDSLGVGTSIARLLALPGVHGVIGEGALYLAAPVHCGVSFRVTDPVDDSPASDWTLPMLKRLPAATVVTAVLISGCLGAG